ncbi:MAG: NAD(+) synthase [Bacteroidales bacterium]
MNYGYIRVAAAVPQIKVANPEYNAEQIISLIKEAAKNDVELLVFPELSLTSATCGDIFLNKKLIDSAEQALSGILTACSDNTPLIVLGMPVIVGNKTYNAAVLFQNGKILHIIPKSHLSQTEKRWFSSGKEISSELKMFCGQDTMFTSHYICQSGEITITAGIGEDALSANESDCDSLIREANIIAMPAAYPEVAGRYSRIRSCISTMSEKNHTGYVFASAGVGESTTDYVYSGASIIAENGKIITEGERFNDSGSLTISEIDIELLMHERRSDNGFNRPNNKTDYIHAEFSRKVQKSIKLLRKINAHPFVPADKDELSERCIEIFNIQTAGLIQRMRHTGCTKAVVGISGGLDSTLSLLVTVNAFDKSGLDRKDIIGTTMPGFGTTDRTYTNAVSMINSLGATFMEINLKQACLQHFKDIDHDIDNHNTVYENAQARERTQILMDMANKNGAMLVGTGDMSEIALGWSTYNGDHMSMYNVNCGVPKTLARYMVAWIAMKQQGDIRNILLDVVNTPISPELVPADKNGNIKQKTEDLVGPYELHDFFLYNFMRHGFSPSKIQFLATEAFGEKYGKGTIKHWLTIFFRRFFSMQFKRSCSPDGPAVGSIGLSPRGGWIMPSDVAAGIWIKECENLQD